MEASLPRIALPILLLMAIGLVALALFIYQILRHPQQMLTLDSGDVRADAAVVLGGSPDDRGLRAAELYRQGRVSKIIVSGTGDTEIAAWTLERFGVPASDIIKESKSASTYQNAKFSVPLLRKMGAKKVIVVTSWYHSRRAMACFRRFAPDMTIYSRPTYHGYDPASADQDEINSFARMESLKLLFYILRYGLPIAGS